MTCLFNMKSVCYRIFYYARIKTWKASGVERGTHRPPLPDGTIQL